MQSGVFQCVFREGSNDVVLGDKGTTAEWIGDDVRPCSVLHPFDTYTGDCVFNIHYTENIISTYFCVYTTPENGTTNPHFTSDRHPQFHVDRYRGGVSVSVTDCPKSTTNMHIGAYRSLDWDMSHLFRIILKNNKASYTVYQEGNCVFCYCSRIHGSDKRSRCVGVRGISLTARK